jgi:prophage antirepressor-like protein
MNDIRIFENPVFGQIRTLGTVEEPLFCLVDICKALELNPSKVSQRLEDDVLSKYPIFDNLNRVQQANFINEDGLYDVILDSRKPEAKMFRKWITSEVLPSIRKTGSYSVQNTFKDKVEGSMIWVRGISDLLHLNDVSKLALVKQVAEPLGLPTPNYVQSKGVLKSAKELLKVNDCGISSIAFNKLAVNAGLLEDKTRNSSHGEIKHFKSITENGSTYGENQVNPNNPKETQPLWYEDKFGEVIKIIGL